MDGSMTQTLLKEGIAVSVSKAFGGHKKFLRMRPVPIQNQVCAGCSKAGRVHFVNKYRNGILRFGRDIRSFGLLL